MTIKRKNKEEGEGGLTLKGLLNELNDLFKEGNLHFLDEDAEEKTETQEDNNESIEISQEDLAGGYVTYDRVRDAVLYNNTINVNDAYGKKIPTIAFLAAPQMMEGVVETIREMNAPTIVAFEDSLITKAFIAKGIVREEMIMKYKNIPALMFDEDGGMCRLSINRKDGYDFIFGENGMTRFIIFDEAVCPDSIPNDIITDDRKWGKRMTSEIPKLIEKTIEESKPDEKKTALCNFPAEIDANDALGDVKRIKKPIIGDIMKEFADAKKFGKVKDDTFVEFMKPENKEAVANAVTSSLTERTKPLDEIEPTADEVFANDVMNAFTNSSHSERWKRDGGEVEEEVEVEVEDTNPDCFRCVVDYMAKEGVDSINFYTDEDGLIHCDVQIKTVYKVELDK